MSPETDERAAADAWALEQITLRASFFTAWAESIAPAARQPPVFGPGIVASVGFSLGLRWMGVRGEFWLLPPATMLAVVPVVIVWFWLMLTTSATVIRVLRANGRWRPIAWVPLPKTFEVAVVTAALFVPIMIGVVFLIVPGLFLALFWSQASFLLIENRTSWFGAARHSYEVMRHRWPHAFVAWLAIAATQVAAVWAGWLVGDMAAGITSSAIVCVVFAVAAKAIADLLGVVGLAALYVALFPEERSF